MLGIDSVLGNAAAYQGANRSVVGNAAGYSPQTNVPVSSAGSGSFYIPPAMVGRNGLDPVFSSGFRVPTGPLKSEGDVRTGYAPTGNAALDAYNNQMADKIAKERWFNQFGLSGSANPARADAVSMQNPYNMRRDVANNMALGTYADPTYGGATTNISGLLSQYQAGGGYKPQMVDLGRINGALDNFGGGYQYERVAAPTAVSLNGADQAQVRGMQMGNLGMLQQASLGNGPSAAQAQLQRGTDANIAQQMSLAAALRGGSGGAAQRNARNQAALIQQRSGQDATALRNTEMQQAQSAYAGALQGTRGQDMTWAGQQADVGFQNNAQRMQQQMANQSAGLQANQQNNSYYSGLLGMNLQGQGMNQSAGLQANSQNNAYQQGLLGMQYNYANLGQNADFARIQALMQMNAQQDALKKGGKGSKNTLQAVGGGLLAAGGVIAAPFTSGASLPVAATGVGMAVDGLT
jgi:hypothetical protein